MTRRRAAGFTLLEVLIAIVIMGIVLPIALRGITNALAAADNAKRLTEASALAQSKLNELLSTSDPTTFGTSGDFGAEWPDYQWTCQTVTDDQGMTQVTLSVTWTARGQKRQFDLATILNETTTEVTS